MKRAPIPIARPWFDARDEAAVASVVRSGWVLQGLKVAEFERLLGAYIGSTHVVATSSCTTALHLAFLLAGLRPGDEVIVPSFSFIASANSIIHAGGTPVFVDIDPRTYNMDPRDVQAKITTKTKAILAVHQIGLPADMPAILAIAKRHQLVLIEDAACGLGARIGSQHVGTFGDMAAFSFHPRKAITTAEGGLLITKTKHAAQAAQMLRAHGASVSVSERHTSHRVLHESYPLVGYNFRMSDIHATLGISQFQKLPAVLAKRQAIAYRYMRALQNHPDITVPFIPTGFTHSWQSYVIRIAGTSHRRDRVMQQLLDAGIATRRGVMASHQEKPYRARYPGLSLPHTEQAAAQTIALPIYPQLNQRDQAYIIARLQAALRNFKNFKAKL